MVYKYVRQGVCQSFNIEEEDMLFFLPRNAHVRKGAGNDEKEAARATFA